MPSTASVGQRLQHEHLRARQQRRVHLERRILRRRADQDDVAGLDAREEGVLLRLVEAMDLVHEDDRPPAHAPPPILRRGHDLLDLLDAGEHGAERHEVRLRDVGDHARERRLAGAWRSPEDDRLQQVALDRLAQRLAWREDVVLPDDLVERARAHAFGERRAGAAVGQAGLKTRLYERRPRRRRESSCALPPCGVDENRPGRGDVE